MKPTFILHNGKNVNPLKHWGVGSTLGQRDLTVSEGFRKGVEARPSGSPAPGASSVYLRSPGIYPSGVRSGLPMVLPRSET